MAYKTNDATKRSLRTNYELACNAYLLELLQMWELSSKDGFWVGDEIGGMYCHGDIVSLNLDEIIFCVERDICLSDFLRFSDYTSKCIEYNFNVLSIKAYFNGAPQVPQETFDKLDALKKEMEDCIAETKSMF